MPCYVALLRAVNVGGTGKLPMADLRALAESCGCSYARTYIQSGNLVATRKGTARQLQATLAAALATRMGKPVGVLVRTAAELEAVLAANPFPEAPPERVLVLFLDAPPAPGALAGWRIPGGERLTVVGRELFIHFPDGMGASRLKVPFADVGTGRNLNTVRALLAMARDAA